MYAPEKKAEILEKILLLTRTMSMAKACAEIGAPQSTVEDWIEADPALSGQYLRAREFRADYLNEESIEILDKPPEKIIQLGEEGEGGSSRIDPAWVALQAHRANLRQRVIRQMAPKKFGARIELEHSGEVRGGSHPDLSKLSDEQLEQYIAMQALLEGRESA
jgi:hypothetical protein